MSALGNRVTVVTRERHRPSAGLTSLGNAGPHCLSETLYAFISGTATNGGARADRRAFGDGGWAAVLTQGRGINGIRILSDEVLACLGDFHDWFSARDYRHRVGGSYLPSGTIVRGDHRP